MSSNYCIPSHRLLKKLAETIGMPPIKRPTRQRHRTFIREWRVYAGLKQNEAAARLEIEPSTLSRIETGKSPYDQDILERIALAYGCDPEDLLSINPLQPDPPKLVYDRLKLAPKDVQDRAIAIIDALLKAG